MAVGGGAGKVPSNSQTVYLNPGNGAGLVYEKECQPDCDSGTSTTRTRHRHYLNIVGMSIVQKGSRARMPKKVPGLHHRAGGREHHVGQADHGGEQRENAKIGLASPAGFQNSSAITGNTRQLPASSAVCSEACFLLSSLRAMKSG